MLSLIPSHWFMMTAGRPKLTDKRICFNCTFSQTYTNQWYKHDGKYYCKKCNNKLFDNPKWHPKRICYKLKRVLLKDNPRKGTCYNCGKETKRTEMHHLEYHDDDPLKDTFELCDHCHGLTKDGGRRGK
jgi:hypothetical protein